MLKKIITKNNLIFILTHSIFSLSFYYFMLLLADLILKGAISRKMQLGLIPILILFLAIFLAFLMSNKKVKKTQARPKFLFFLLIITSVIILVISYLPHDPIVAFAVGLCFFLLILINKKSILKKT